MKKKKLNLSGILKYRKTILLILALIAATIIRATEVYTCAWENEIYSCDLITESEKEKLSEPPLVIEADKENFTPKFEVEDNEEFNF